MNLIRPSVPVLVAGLMTAGLLTAPADAARPDAGRSAATVPTCSTSVIGVLPSGKLLDRWVVNTTLKEERRTAAPLPYTPESMYSLFGEPTETGGVLHSIAHSVGQPAKLVDIIYTDGSPTITTKIVGRYRPTPKARTWANSGRFYGYAITPNGNLTRFTRFRDPDTGQYWMANPKTVKTGMSKIKAMSYSVTQTLTSGVKKDLLYATTRGGALLQIQVPWNTPGKPKVTTLKSTGFAAVTGLSLSFCNKALTIASIIAIEKGNNRARLWTLSSAYNPRPANLTRRPLVAPGAEWRLRATF